MRFWEFFRDKIGAVLIGALVMVLVGLILGAVGVDFSVVLAVEGILGVGAILAILGEFWRKRRFFRELTGKVEGMDQAYLVLETMREPEFYEGRLVFEALRAINKSMAENVAVEREQGRDFREYVEMWIHEVKKPLASLKLAVENLWKSPEGTGVDSEDGELGENGDFEVRERVLGNLRELERRVEQVLYYVRAGSAEEDYLIRRTDLTEVVRKVGMRNMEDFLGNGVEFLVGEVDFRVATDSKWLEFILNQVVNNSIKYRRKTGAKVWVRAWEEGGSEGRAKGGKSRGKRVVLEVSDNGIGISAGDLPKVFEKSFTGENGRKGEASTGMGLYIARNLCEKLGHRIEVESEEGKGTKVRIVFGEDEFLEVVG